MANIYVPESTSAGKAAQIAMYGANLIKCRVHDQMRLLPPELPPSIRFTEATIGALTF